MKIALAMDSWRSLRARRRAYKERKAQKHDKIGNKALWETIVGCTWKSEICNLNSVDAIGALGTFHPACWRCGRQIDRANVVNYAEFDFHGISICFGFLLSFKQTGIEMHEQTCYLMGS